MTRSERLAKEGKVSTMWGIASVIANQSKVDWFNLHYLCTEDCMYDGEERSVDIYTSNVSQEIYAVVSPF